MQLVSGTGARAANPYATSNHILFSAAMPEQLAQEKAFDGVTFGAFSHAVHRLLSDISPGITNLQFARAAKSEVNLSTQSPDIYCAPTRRSLPFPLAGV